MLLDSHGQNAVSALMCLHWQHWVRGSCLWWRCLQTLFQCGQALIRHLTSPLQLLQLCLGWTGKEDVCKCTSKGCKRATALLERTHSQCMLCWTRNTLQQPGMTSCTMYTDGLIDNVAVPAISLCSNSVLLTACHMQINWQWLAFSLAVQKGPVNQHYDRCMSACLPVARAHRCSRAKLNGPDGMWVL